MLGREISFPIDILTGTQYTQNQTTCPSQYIEWMRDAMQRAVDIAHENLQTSFQKQKKYHDLKLKHRQFEIGTKVLRWYPPKANQKLGLGWTGPYVIHRKLSDITYEIQDCKNSKLKVVHVDHLKPLRTRENTNNTINQDESVFLNTHDVNQSILVDDTSDDVDEVPIETQNFADSSPVSPKYSRRGRLIKPPIKFSP